MASSPWRGPSQARGFAQNRFRDIEQAGQSRSSPAEDEAGNAMIQNARLTQVIAHHFEKFTGTWTEDFSIMRCDIIRDGRSPTEGTSTSLPSGISVGTALPNVF